MTTKASTKPIWGSINPKNGPQFSPNLYKFMSQMYVSRACARVYRDQLGTLWLGEIDDHWFNGLRLMRALSGAKLREIGSYPNLAHNLVEVEDFWQRYEKIGRCAIDPEHAIGFIGDETRWQIDGEVRHCRWCKARTEHRITWTESHDRESWITVAAGDE